MAVVLQSRFATVMTTAEWINALSGGEMPERGSIFAANQLARQQGAAGRQLQ